MESFYSRTQRASDPVLLRSGRHLKSLALGYVMTQSNTILRFLLLIGASTQVYFCKKKSWVVLREEFEISTLDSLG